MILTGVSRSLNLIVILCLITIFTLSGCDAEDVSSSTQDSNSMNEELVAEQNKNTNQSK